MKLVDDLTKNNELMDNDFKLLFRQQQELLNSKPNET